MVNPSHSESQRTVLGKVVELRDDDGLIDIDRFSVAYRRTP
jgi:hypothetical protein